MKQRFSSSDQAQKTALAIPYLIHKTPVIFININQDYHRQTLDYAVHLCNSSNLLICPMPRYYIMAQFKGLSAQTPVGQ